MQPHHGFSPTLFETVPRPSEKEILVKMPAFLHDGRPRSREGAENG